MPLRNKYLKYSPEITLEIFTLVWDKLLSLKIKGKIYNFYPENNLETFKKGGYIWTGPCDEYSFGIDNNSGGSINKEITVQEILGYDLFVKDEFVLPERWVINAHLDGVELSLINNYFNKLSNSNYFNSNYHYYHFPDMYGNKTNTNCNKHTYSLIKPDYTEITFEQFKKYVLKKTIEEPKVKSKEVIPEYVECIKQVHTNEYPKVGNVIKADENGNLFGICMYRSITYDRCFKPSTKEAFDAQNEPKSIEKWSVGSYVVFLRDFGNVKIGHIDVIEESINESGCIYLKKYLSLDIKREKYNELAWFATLSEAEEFAKTLVEPVKEEVEQPLNQAVHCKTQEEWDFVLSKFNPIGLTSDKFNTYKSNSIIIFDYNDKDYYGAYSNKNETFCNNIISFQEWCDFNGYKMEKEVKFEAGKWYKVCLDNIYHHIFKHKKYIDKDLSVDLSSGHYDLFSKIWRISSSFKLNKVTSFEELSIEEIQQYLPADHPDKIEVKKEFKVGDWLYFTGEGRSIITEAWVVGRITKISSIAGDLIRFGFASNHKDGFRHATPEEINNHLISIGQIPEYPIRDRSTDDLSNYGLPTEPPSYMYEMELEHSISKPKLILSIDDEELQMVSIIKTNTIKQLLNLE